MLWSFVYLVVRNLFVLVWLRHLTHQTEGQTIRPDPSESGFPTPTRSEFDASTAEVTAAPAG